MAPSADASVWPIPESKPPALNNPAPDHSPVRPDVLATADACPFARGLSCCCGPIQVERSTGRGPQQGLPAAELKEPVRQPHTAQGPHAVSRPDTTDVNFQRGGQQCSAAEGK